MLLRAKTKAWEFTEGLFSQTGLSSHFQFQMNEVQRFPLCGRLNENVCITCFADDLMSTWRCHMKDSLLPCQFIFCFICSIAWSAVKSNQLAVTHSDDNKSRHYHFYLGPSLKQRQNEIFLSGGRITYDPFMSCWEPLENNNTPQQKHMNNWKAPSVINLMGFAYFASLARSRQKKSHDIWNEKRLQNTLRS